MTKKRKKQIKKNYGFMSEPSLIENVDYFADKIGVSRSLMICNMLNTALDDLRIMEKSGILKTGISTRNFLGILKNQVGNEKSFSI